jgi:hypothetical protein
MREKDPTDQDISTHLFLAEGAQVADGKLYVLGGVIRGNTMPQPGLTMIMAIAGSMDIPWGEHNKDHTLKVDIIDEEGAAYTVIGPDGKSTPLSITAQFRTGAPPQLPRGASGAAPFAVQFPLPILKQGTLIFRVSVDGRRTQDLAFTTVIARSQ